MPASTQEAPAASTRVVEERPPEGLARGQYAWPDWGVLAVSAVGIVAALVVLASRLRKLRSGS